MFGIFKFLFCLALGGALLLFYLAEAFYHKSPSVRVSEANTYIKFEPTLH